MQIQTSQPREGAKVVGVVNRKEEIGRVPLEDALPVIKQLYPKLGEIGIHFMPLGSSLFGSELIKVSQSYAKVRRVSRIIDVCVEGLSSQTVAAIEDTHWKKLNPTDYFSISFINDSGEVCTTGTMSDQSLSTKDGFVFSAIGTPSEYYQVKRGFVAISSFLTLPALGEVISMKLLRGNKQDIEDMVAIAIAGNNLPWLVSGKGEEVLNNRIRHMASEDDSGRLTGLGKRLSRIIHNILEHATRLNGNVSDNLSWFHGVRADLEALTKSLKDSKR